MQILILGMHRSGTSSVTRLVNMMGAYLGAEDDLIGANAENPKGFWERRDVIEINDAILRHFNCEWYDLAAWPHLLPALPDHLIARIKMLVEQLDQHGVWAIKDPRLCQTLPYWLPYLSKPVGVHVHRPPLEIAQSLHTRNHFPQSYGLALWEHSAVGMLNVEKMMPTYHIDYPTLAHVPVSQIFHLHAFLHSHHASLTLPSDEDIVAFIDPRLRREQADNRSGQLSAHQQKTLERDSMISAVSPESLALLTTLAPAMRGLEQSAQLLRHTQDARDRALQTITEHEARLKELFFERDDWHKQAHDFQRQYQECLVTLADQQAINQQLLSQIATLHESANQHEHIVGALNAELTIIKHTRWWKLREMLLKLSKNKTK